MARVLVLYGTNEGHTEKVATTIAETLIAGGCQADLIQAGTIEPSIRNYDGVIVAASIHGGRFQRPVVDTVRAHSGEIAARPNAFIAVCLAVLNRKDPAVQAQLATIFDRFAHDTGWVPAIAKPVAGALLYTRYNFLMRWIMKRIVAKAGGEIDTSRDYVYTDWDDVKAFAKEFGAKSLASQTEKSAVSTAGVAVLPAL
jgi:menaquinone-dependent protoporphyrinogen oxidase